MSNAVRHQCFLLALFCFSKAIAGTCAQVDLNAMANQVDRSMGLPPKTLYAVERPDLRQELIEFQYEVRASVPKPRAEPTLPLAVTDMLIVDLSKQGYRVVNGQITSVAVDLDDDSLWRIGIDCSTQEISHLYGFADYEHGFNSIVRGLGLADVSAEQALEIQQCLVALTLRRGRLDEVDGQAQALQSILRRHGASAGLDEILARWSKYPESLRRKIASPTITILPSNAGFAIKFFVSAENGIEQLSILVKPDGEAHLTHSELTLDWTTGKRSIRGNEGKGDRRHLLPE